MNELPKITMMGVTMHPWTMQQTVDEIFRRIEDGRFTQHVVVNVAKLVHMRHDAALRDSVTACDITNIDGMGVVWGAKLLGFEVPERVAGVDLFFNLLAMAESRQRSVYILGATDEVVKQAVEKLRVQFPGLRIAGFHHGYFWDDEQSVVEEIANSGAELLFVAITSPKKEQFIDRWKDRLGVKFAMGVGGTIDIVAGKTKRAPQWMQKCGMEWLYRVIQEPGRMWKRYFNTNLAFAGLLLKAMVSRKFRETGK